jgi:RNA polymerase sigma factor (TIGR02999 family)
MNPSSGPIDTQALLVAVYGELKRLAQRYLVGEDDNLFQPTALVHEACARLMQADQQWNDRTHFIATAARTMRRILVDQARRTRAVKRGSGHAHITHNDEIHPGGLEVDLIELDRALHELRGLDPRQALVVELRFFAGCSIDECVNLLGVSRRTVCSDWHLARAWLYDRLRDRTHLATCVGP